jgi:hypothetical protein
MGAIQMKRYATILAAAALTAAVSVTSLGAAGTTALKDIDTYWGKQAVQYFYDNHYISGDNGYFHPDTVLTRESVAAIINNMIGSDFTGKSTFKDVKGRWSENAIASLVDKKIMSGYSNGTFQPAQDISREEFAVIAYNYLSYKGVGMQNVSTASFADANQISSWALKPVSVLSSMGYIQGSNNLFHPKNKITRGEAVSILYRMVNPSQTAVTNTANTTDATVPAVQDSKTTVENAVFSDITDVYGSIKKFADDGIMYWQGDKLHIGIKSNDKRDKLAEALLSDKKLSADVVNVQHANMSYNDYKTLMIGAESTYRASEGTNADVRTDVDYLNEKVLLIVKSINKDTQQALIKKYGDSVKIVIQ